MIITVEQIMADEPCSYYPRERVEELVGDGITPKQIARLSIPPEDRIWVLTRSTFWRDLNALAEFAAFCAEDTASVSTDAAADAAAGAAARECARAAARAAAACGAAAYEAAAAVACEAAYEAAAVACEAAYEAAAYEAAWDRYLNKAVELLERH